MENEAGMEAAPITPSAFSFLRPPSLLHVYWGLHAIHIVLAAIALCAWWRLRRVEEGERRKEDQSSVRDTIDAQSSPLTSPSTRGVGPLLPSPVSLLLKTAPWLLLALLFWIPGLYLEWPSDPWEHLRRINEWHTLNRITAHSSWMKTSYFIPYSLTGSASGLTQLTWLGLYYTGICMLLSWQYYRLARTTGLSDRASFVLVILNALTFGNDVFSFYRYYGLSSSIVAQIGAVAITRIAIETASTGRSRPALDGAVITDFTLPSRLLLVAGSCTSLLLLLITFNHLQGLGIALLGVSAVVAWRAAAFIKNGVVWLALCMVITNGLFLILYQRSPLVESLQAAGWLNGIYGFNLYTWPSPAAGRAMDILGGIGILGLLAGLGLMFRNHVTGWLTLLPPLALSMPLLSVPFATVASEQPSGIAIFHRLLFATPACLALVTIFSHAARNAKCPTLSGPTLWPIANPRFAGPVCAPMVGSLLLLNCATSDRIWASVAKTPDDLMLRGAWDTIADYQTVTKQTTPSAFVSNAIVGSVADNFGSNRALRSGRYNRLDRSLQLDLADAPGLLNYNASTIQTGIVVISPTSLTSPHSQAAMLSQHWSPQDALLISAGTAELMQLGLQRALKPVAAGSGQAFIP